MSVMLETFPLALIAGVDVPLKFTHALAEYEGAEPEAVDNAVAVEAVVALAALPEMLIPHVPDAPDPVVDGTPKLVLAVAVSEAPVPPLTTAKSVPDQLSLLIVLKVANDPNPKLVLAALAELAPVPPFAIGTALTNPSVASN